MPRLTITITDEQAELLEDKTGEGCEYESKSEAVRDFIQRGEQLIQQVDQLESENNQLRRQIDTATSRLEGYSELQEEHSELQDEYEALEARHNDLQRQLAAVNARQKDVGELVEYVEEQRELTQYQERRQRLLDDANILRRWKWKLTGVPVDEQDGNDE